MATFTPNCKLTLISNDVSFFNLSDDHPNKSQVIANLNLKDYEFQSLGKTGATTFINDGTTVTITRLFDNEVSAQEWITWVDSEHNASPSSVAYYHTKTIDPI